MDVKPYKIPMPFKKLTQERIDAIAKDLDEGSTHRLAALCNGITERILEIWQAQGKIDIAFGNEDSLCAILVRAIAKVKAKEVKWCRKAIKSKLKGHKGAEWTLERAYWRDFSASAPNIENDERLTALEEAQSLNKDENNGEVESKDSK